MTKNSDTKILFSLHNITLLICFACSLIFTDVLAQRPQPFPDSTDIIPDTLLFRLEKVQAAINQVNADNKKGYNLNGISKNLRTVKASLADIDDAMKVENNLPDVKDLLNYRMILSDISKNTDVWRKNLSASNAQLQNTSELIISFSRDSLLQTDGNDAGQKKLYAGQISDLKDRLQQAGKITVADLDTVSRLLADVSAVNFQANDLRTLINEYIRESGNNVLNREASYLWNTEKKQNPEKLTSLVKGSYSGQDKILRYFFNSTWDNRILLLIVAIGFFGWVYVNFRLMHQHKLTAVPPALDFKYIRSVPILSTLVVLFSISPLFEPDSPSIYMELNLFILLIVMTILLFRKLEKEQLKWWLLIFALYIAFIACNAIVNESFYLRSIFILLNIVSLYVGFRFYRKAAATGMEVRFVKPVVFIFILFNFITIIFNVIGRLSLAKTFAVTAISGLTQLISLSILIRIMMEAMELHIQVSILSKRLFSKINVATSRESFRKGIIFISVFLWILVFAINLNIVNWIYGLIGHLLTKPRTFGSISFTLGNILFFSVIIYLSNKIQKNIGIFFGETDVNFTSNNVPKDSKLTLIRLVVIVVGFLFAVMASGVPLDKVTVLLGALGVGIGLGLQNIINNFVSGIILIFEKPFNIGDYIELADKKGKVLDIGIRSSKMLTPQGSRVIIPNGDLLSGRLVNYTQKNAHLKSELTFKVNLETDLQQLKQLITETVEKSEGILKKAPKQILINSVTADSVEIKVMVWLENVYLEPVFKSNLLEQLLVKFKEKQIKTM